jgi:hypothetical protein
MRSEANPLQKRFVYLAVVLAAFAAAVHVSPALASSSSVAVCGTGGEEATAQSALVGTGRFSSVDTLSCDGSTPSLSTLQSYDAVYAFPDGAYADFPTLAQNLADYVDGGGHLVLGQWGFASCCGTWWNTRLDTGGYLPFTNRGSAQDPDPSSSGGSSVTVNSMLFDAPSSALLSGVSTVGSFDAALVGLAPGATQVAHWDDVDATPAVAVKGNVVGLNLWLDGTGGGGFSSGDWLALLTNALLVPAPAAPGNAPSHAGYCSVAGNVNPFTGASITPGTFLNLDTDQASTDPSYKGAVAANFVEGIGITCDPPPVGYLQSGFATDADNVGGGFYPYFAKRSA